jgi:hypothetical protein
VRVGGVEYEDRSGECDSSNTLFIRQKLSSAVRGKISQFAAQKKQYYN